MPEENVEAISHANKDGQQSAASDRAQTEMSEEEILCWDGIPRVVVMP
jgi:hypothetical protein